MKIVCSLKRRYDERDDEDRCKDVSESTLYLHYCFSH